MRKNKFQRLIALMMALILAMAPVGPTNVAEATESTNRPIQFREISPSLEKWVEANAHKKGFNAKYSTNENYILQISPEDGAVFYPEDKFYVQFGIRDPYTDYYTTPVFGLYNENSELLKVALLDNPFNEYGVERHYYGDLDIGLDTLPLGEYIYVIMAMPTDSEGNRITTVDSDDIPSIWGNFTLKASSHTHSVVTDPRVEPSCEQSGLTEGSHCSTCGEVISSQNTIPALGHDFVRTGSHMGDCEEGGEIYYTCSRCGETAIEDIDSVNHSWDSGVVTREATCSNVGQKAYTCQKCGSVKYESIPTLPHDYAIETHKPSCAEEGYDLYVCNTCGYSEKRNKQEKLDHNYIVEHHDVSCTENGYDRYTCETCGYSEVRNEQDKLGHEYVLVDTVHTNCETEGTIYYECSRCGERKTEIIPAGSHTWDKGQVKTEPTYEKDGLRVYTCTVCGKTKNEVIPKLVDTRVPLDKTKISAISNTSTGVKLTWNLSENADGYHIYRKGVNDDQYKLIKTVGKGIKTCTDKEALNCKAVYYRVKAYHGDQESTTANKRWVFVKRASISKISNLADGIKITWSKNSSATGYEIYRKKGSGSYSKIAVVSGGSSSSFTDDEATTNGSTYYYKIKAYKTNNDNNYRSSESPVKKIRRLSRPTISSLKNSGQGQMTVTLKSKNSKAGGYQIQYCEYSDFSENALSKKITDNATLTKKLSSLTPGEKYYVRVRSYKKVDDVTYYSAWSGKKSLTNVGLNKTSLSLQKGKTSTLKVLGSSKTPTWKSSDTSIASVNSSGKVTAKAKGTATITMTLGGIKYKCTVKVTTISAKQKAWNNLYNYIQRYGDTNSSGNKFIRWDYDGSAFGIAYDSEDNNFQFIFYDDDVTLYAYMGRYGSSDMEVNFYYDPSDSADYCYAVGHMDVATYDKETDIYFRVLESYLGSSGTYYKQMANAATRLAMVGWAILVEENGITTMKNLGFTRFVPD